MTTFDEIKSSSPDMFPESVHVECREGWAGIVASFLLDARMVCIANATDLRVLAVRQDLGALRIDAEYESADKWLFSRFLLLAEFRSRVTCEECGRPGHMRTTGGWKRCRCDEHSTPEEREQPPRPAWTLGRETSKGFLWYDQAIDDVRIVDDLASIGMPAHHIERRKDGL
ncbi:hypothetical protein [Rhizobium phaseoli]|uniref:Uncharacterized protein n=1 Tax=Rhizobium phaseoli TaxID=396 RepID=A0ABN4QNI0_9HYPH|nr:hypothetical protein [Rhizobium phaseoli]ANL87082.1 hypothetical protein AMC81_PA00059 [Rhizobium phaseoli]ANL93591.1 hypothetical protein AMC80_PA00059 [Rhizobium phaseoli]